MVVLCMGHGRGGTHWLGGARPLTAEGHHRSREVRWSLATFAASNTHSKRRQASRVHFRVRFSRRLQRVVKSYLKRDTDLKYCAQPSNLKSLKNVKPYGALR